MIKNYLRQKGINITSKNTIAEFDSNGNKIYATDIEKEKRKKDQFALLQNLNNLPNNDQRIHKFQMTNKYLEDQK